MQFTPPDKRQWSPKEREKRDERAEKHSEEFNYVLESIEDVIATSDRIETQPKKIHSDINSHS